MSSISASSIQKSFKYDVFLSFSGEDTRKNFVDHLYHALKQRGINTYKDDEEIKKGKRISNELITSIQDSKFHIIIFSKNYASSFWCLDELVKIMECQKGANNQTAYPVFYDVDPNEVRNQSGVVGEAFSKHENLHEEAVGIRWRDALKQAASLAGWELKNNFDGHQAKFIQKIVEEVSLELHFSSPSVDETLIGMETRVNVVVSSLETEIDDVRFIGIKGMGGAGKTTLARVVFDQISFRYEGSSFVKNVRERSGQGGLESLQKIILSDVLHAPNIIVKGDSDFRRMLCGRKVLIVLDDVDHINQLEALARKPNWFKPGSRIIITTRDQQVLVAHKVPKNLILDVSLLSREEATCLFNKYAFGRVISDEGYDMLSEQVVHYASGLPLTLKVLGSSLCGKDELEWADALERLKTIPLQDTLDILELSYTSLEEEHKKIFLDVACMLKGWDKEEAIRALESLGLHARIGLKVLELKSLITVSGIDGCLSMHDHIEEMGKNIVRRLHPDDPSRHSRLWNQDEIEDILVEDKDTQETRCIKALFVDPTILMKGLRKMKELRFLDVTSKEKVDPCDKDDANLDYIDIGEDSLYLPNSLRYLRWNDYPFKCLPKTFQANNLVGLKMISSNIEQLWTRKEKKVLKKLRFIHLFGCYMLRSLDIGPIPNIERLVLKNCDQLEELHIPTKTSKLIFIEISRCKTFRSLDIGQIPNLEKLSLVACYELKEFHIPVNHSNLRYLNLYESGLRTLDLEQAENLNTLKVENNYFLAELRLPIESLNLKHLTLHYSMLKTLDITRYQNLETLDLKCYDLVELHLPFEKLKSLLLLCSELKTLNLMRNQNLEVLRVLYCKDLLQIYMPIESPTLKSISISCSKLKTLNLTGTRNLESLDLEQCEDLIELHMPTKSPQLKNIIIRCSKLRTLQLGVSPYLQSLYFEDCFDLVDIYALIGYLSGSVRLKPFLANQGLPMAGSSDNLHLIARPLGICSLHPDNNLPKFHFECIYRELLLSSTRNLAELITNFGICACKNLASLSRIVCGLQHLRRLTLEGSIPEVPKELDQLECLEELTLLSTNIECLPDSICTLKHLKLLQLKSCGSLKQLPDDLGRLEGLEELRLSDCTSLRDIPNSIYEMKRLKRFHLKNCILVKKLPKEIGRLQCLKELNIQGTWISDIPESIFEMEDLRFIV